MNITSQFPFYDPFNNAWIYVCPADDGSFWLRTAGGKWGQIDAPLQTNDLQADFAKYIAVNLPIDSKGIVTDNTGDQVSAPDDLPNNPPQSPPK